MPELVELSRFKYGLTAGRFGIVLLKGKFPGGDGIPGWASAMPGRNRAATIAMRIDCNFMAFTPNPCGWVSTFNSMSPSIRGKQSDGGANLLTRAGRIYATRSPRRSRRH